MKPRDHNPHAVAAVAMLIASAAVAQTPTPTPHPCGSPPFVVTSEGDTISEPSLRWAIECANNEAAGPAVAINFSIASPSGITIGSLLDLSRANVTIDGSTQTGFVAGDILAGTLPDPAVEITGTVGAGCLRMNDDSQTLIGVQITCDTDTFDAALQVNGDNSAVRSSIIGDAGAGMGIRVGGDNVTIGGTSAGDGNVVRLVSVDGIHALDGTGLVVHGNLIDAIYEDGIFLGSGTSLTSATIGGAAAGARNIITGCGLGTGAHSAISIGANTTTVSIENNRIGVDAAGNPDGNFRGIRVAGASISGITIDDNLISASTQSAVQIGTGASSVSITDNLIGTNAAGGEQAGFCNGLPQIDDQTSSATITGNTEADCDPTPTPTPTPLPLGCCVLSCDPASLPTVTGGYCLDTDTGFGDVDETFCDNAATANCPPKVRFVAGGTCAGGCEAATATATATSTPTSTPTLTPTDTPTATPSETPTSTSTTGPTSTPDPVSYSRPMWQRIGRPGRWERENRERWTRPERRPTWEVD